MFPTGGHQNELILKPTLTSEQLLRMLGQNGTKFLNYELSTTASSTLTLVVNSELKHRRF